MGIYQRMFCNCTKRKALILSAVAVVSLSLIIGLSVGLRGRSASESPYNNNVTGAVGESSDNQTEAVGESSDNQTEAVGESSDNQTTSSPSSRVPSVSPIQINLSFDFSPSSSPSSVILPSVEPSLGLELPVPNRTSFFVIGCVPYDEGERDVLTAQISSLNATDTDFLIHVGDIKDGRSDCSQDALDDVDSILKLSPVPVFLVVGDNEFNDCTNISPDKALDMWRDTFVGFNAKYWSQSFANLTTFSERPEIFSFLNRKTLFLGVNVVGGRIHDTNEWESRHEDDVEWVTENMLEYESEVHSVVMFGQADADGDTADFFNPLVLFLRKQFSSDIPILYVCADTHTWGYTPSMFDIDNFLRVRIKGGVSEPVVRITVDPETAGTDPVDAFQVERFLD
ncbi:hypothetical protein MHU86_707 [Fragilaria crotonensis]|nr:hypothetical protein MHU86_707 [Fragilaria crotonensis]